MTNPMQQKVTATFEKWKADFDKAQASFKEKIADARMEHQTDSWRDNLQKKFDEAKAHLEVLQDETNEKAAEAKASYEQKMEEIKAELDR